VVETAIKGWNIHSDVHLPDMPKVERGIRSDGQLLDFLDLNWVLIFLVLSQVENESGASVQYS
jgi:hypothetical protein